MTATYISAQPVEYMVEYGEPLQLRVQYNANAPYWVQVGLKPESIDPSAYEWDKGELYGPFPASQTEVIISRYVPAKWEPPADTRWLFQVYVAHNDDGGPTVYVNDLIRNIFSYGAPLKRQLRINISGEGTTIPTPLPEAHYYDKYTEVTITAIPSSGWKFNKWGGDASGTNTSITITMLEDMTLWAYFVKIPSNGEPQPPGLWPSISAWITEYWWVIAVGIVVLVIGTYAFVRYK